MENQFTQTEIKNLLELVNIAPIKGIEAMTVVLLQQKLQNMLQPAAGALTPAVAPTVETPEVTTETENNTQ